MSRLQSLRLAEFWQVRFEPLIQGCPELQYSPRELLEAVGWLSEGVFCGFFDAREADVVWIRLQPLVHPIERASLPPDDPLLAHITSLRKAKEPFRQSLQMPEGSQKRFEMPLFGHALLLSNRFFHDRLARLCISHLYRVNQREWREFRESWFSADSPSVAQRLVDPAHAPIDPSSLAAGYIHLLEHMENSRSFFKYAKSRSPRGSDFESYCRRIGGLNSWRVPLYDANFRRHFTELPTLLEFTLRPEVEKLKDANWSEFERSFSRQLKEVIDAWETHHLSASLATS